MRTMPWLARVAGAGHAHGILLMLGAVLLFSVNDVLGKWLVASHAVGQVLLLRSLGALALLGPLAWPRLTAPGFRLERPGLQAVRVALGAAEGACFYWAVGHMPLADCITIWMAAPVFVTAISALLPGERVTWRNLALVLLGFAGVVVALGAEFESGALPALVAVAGALLFALFLLSTRQLRATPDAVLALLQMLGGFVLGAAMLAAGGGWRTPGLVEFGLLLLLGIVSTFGHIGVTRSLKLAPASVVVPYQYSFLLWAALFGWLVFDEVPGPGLALGAALIVSAGLLLFREQQRDR